MWRSLEGTGANPASLNETVKWVLRGRGYPRKESGKDVEGGTTALMEFWAPSLLYFST